MVFKIVLNYTITRGADNENRPLRHVSPDFGAAHLIYQFKKLKADYYFRFNQGFTNSQLSPSEQNKTHIYALDYLGIPYLPAFYTMNFTLQYRLMKTMLLKAGVENILDLGYRPYSSGISAYGRNFIFGIKTDF